MKRYDANQPAPYGLYLSTRPFDIRFVGAEGEPLEGKDGASYRHVPTWLAVLLAPALGGAFVLAFPIIVLVAIFGAIGGALFKGVGKRHSYVARNGWQPAAAYFDKKDASRTDGDTPADELADLDAEVGPKAAAEKQGGDQA